MTDERVLAAIAATPQAAFAPPGYPWAFYDDRPVTIPDGLVTIKAALLARLAGQVISVEPARGRAGRLRGR